MAMMCLKKLKILYCESLLRENTNLGKCLAIYIYIAIFAFKMLAVDTRGRRRTRTENYGLPSDLISLDGAEILSGNISSFGVKFLLRNNIAGFLGNFGPHPQKIELNQIPDVNILNILSNCPQLQSITFDECNFKTSFLEGNLLNTAQHLETIKIIGGKNLEYLELLFIFFLPSLREIHISYCSAFCENVLLDAFHKHRFLYLERLTIEGCTNISEPVLRSCFLSEDNALYHIAILRNPVHENTR